MLAPLEDLLHGHVTSGKGVDLCHRQQIPGNWEQARPKWMTTLQPASECEKVTEEDNKTFVNVKELQVTIVFCFFS